MHTTAIATALTSIATAPPVFFENLIMVPLVARGGTHVPTSDYLNLDEALSARQVEITEVSEQGSVPELRVKNRGASPVLIVDGEELVGAKQNRVVNLTILVAAQSELTIPVSCVEAGRWRSRSRALTSSPHAHFASGRAKRMASVTASFASVGAYRSDQSEVWGDIAEKSARLKSSSPTGAMDAMFEEHASFIDACVSACAPVDRQVGAMFAVKNRIIGFDLFDTTHTLNALLPKLVRSVAVDALDDRRSGRSSEVRDAGVASISAATAHFLEAVGSGECHVSPGVGLGENMRLTRQDITGAALVNNGQVVHLSAFALA